MKDQQTQEYSSGLYFQPVVRYILWFYVTVLIAVVAVCGVQTFGVMKDEGDFAVSAASAKLESRIDMTVKLLTSLTRDPGLMNPALSYEDKAAILNGYSDTLGYMMIRIVDKDANVWAEYGSRANLGSRAYMQRLFATGKVQVTDSFAAGADGVTMNYTVAVPIFRDGAVDGCLFAAIYFDEIEERLKTNLSVAQQEFSLYGSENQVMSTPYADTYGKTYMELTQRVTLLYTTAKQTEANMYNRVGGSHWAISGANLIYAAYQPIEGTPWTLFCKVNFFGMLQRLFPQMIALILICTIACILLMALANRYIRSQMGTVNMLVTSVQELEKKIYQNEKPDNVDFKEIISLTSKGLTDGLTGVITRTVFLNQIPNKVQALEADKLAAMCFIDVDNLKITNDTYGHSVGDMTLKNVGYVLREYEKRYDGLVARHGGDEFVILLTGFASREALTDLVEEMTLRLRCDVFHGAGTVQTQCSIGVAVCTKDDYRDVTTLIDHADEALYQVKRNCKGWYQIYRDGGEMTGGAKSI